METSPLSFHWLYDFYLDYIFTTSNRNHYYLRSQIFQYIGTIALPRAYCDQTLFMGSLNRPEHLNVITFRERKVKSSPVAGFLPLRSRFSFTENFPKPEINRSSPDASVLFMISSNNSTNSDDCF